MTMLFEQNSQDFCAAFIFGVRGKLVREECVIHDLSHDDIFDFLKSEYPIDHAEKLIKLVPR